MVKSNRKYQQKEDEDENNSTVECNEDTTTTTSTSTTTPNLTLNLNNPNNISSINEDDEESSSSSSANSSIMNYSNHNKPQAPEPPVTARVITIVPAKPMSQATLVTTLSNSTNSLSSRGGGFINNAYNESESNLFTVFSRETRIPATTDEEGTKEIVSSTTLKHSTSCGAALQRQTGAGSNHHLKSHSFASSASSTPRSQTKNPTAKTSVFRRPAFLVPVIVVCLIAACALLAGVIIVVVRARDNNGQNKTTLLNNKSEGKTTLKPLDIDDNQPPTAASQQAEPVSSSVRSCGVQKYKPNIKLMRIMRGNAAAPFSWPWTVSIGYYGPRSVLPHACGGTLVNKRFIVTATHCVLERSIFSLVGNPIPNSNLYNSIESMMRVYVGVTNRTSDISPVNTYRVAKITSYPNFDTNSFKNDLSIIKLERDIVETDYLSYICLDRHTNTQPNTDVYAVGWGFTDTNFYKASEVLNQVKIQVRQSESCGLAYIPVLQFCAGDPKLGKDTCNGDSGGPLMQQHSDNKWTLVGIVSNGDAMCTGRGIYTNVSFFYDWIIENTRL